MMVNIFLVGDPVGINKVAEAIQSQFTVIKAEKNTKPNGLENFQILSLILLTPLEEDHENCDVNLDEVLDGDREE